MSARNDGGSAFPRQLPDIELHPDEAVELIARYAGMSLRDYFAAKAMAAFMLSVNDDASRRAMKSSGADLFKVVADAAYAHADAMLKARAD